MPRKRPPVHTFGVYIIAYADEEVRRKVEAGEEHIMHPEQLGGRLVYLGPSERLAAWHFYKAVREASPDPLAFMVRIQKGSKTIAEVRIEHTL